jgi:hypothetical protein
LQRFDLLALDEARFVRNILDVRPISKAVIPPEGPRAETFFFEAW